MSPAGPVSAASSRVALVTGGSRGIGRATVAALLDAGWRVFFASRRAESVAAALAELRAAHPGQVDARAADVRRQDDVDGLVAWAVGEAGRLDLLVNNAGIGVFAAVDELDGEQWREVLETNLSGAFYAIRAAAPALRRSGGWIVNVASLAARHAMAGGAAYNASKYGLLGLSEAAMLDLRPHGVRVTTILPGSVASDFAGPAGTARGEEWKLRPEDVARAVLDLVAYPERALPSVLELRPTRPPAK